MAPVGVPPQQPVILLCDYQVCKKRERGRGGGGTGVMALVSFRGGGGVGPKYSLAPCVLGNHCC